MSQSSASKDFFKNQTGLIVEPSRAFSSNLHAALLAMGMESGSIYIARKFDEAVRMLEQMKPNVLVTEYEIDQRFGLSLVEQQCKYHEDTAKISIVVTRNSSDSAVAEAAEEQVDAFLLKPFSPEAFQQKVIAAVERKANPSHYAAAIMKAKEQIRSGDTEAATATLKQAKTLHPQPTLARFYQGQIYQSQGDTENALREYREGRRLQPLHYKCLVSEFEILIQQKKYEEAYRLVGPIKDHYPLTPKRLSQILVAAVFTHHFDDMEGFYELFLKLDQRSPELVKVAAMAFLTAGKHFLKLNLAPKAVPLFEKCLTITGRDMSYVEKIIAELLKSGAHAEAEEIMAKAPADAVGTPMHNRLLFKIDVLTSPLHQVIERGRKLVAAGEGDHEVYETLVRLMVQAGKATLAESVISKAVADDPSIRESLYKTFEDAARKKA
jgi:tetratricopeptide (TPR) repeat protein